jgi:hypothetical protein
MDGESAPHSSLRANFISNPAVSWAIVVIVRAAPNEPNGHAWSRCPGSRLPGVTFGAMESAMSHGPLSILAATGLVTAVCASLAGCGSSPAGPTLPVGSALQTSPTVVLSGLITDTDGNPIPSVAVYALGDLETTTTDGQGRFIRSLRLLNRTPGTTITVVARKNGFSTAEQAIPVPAPLVDKISVNFSLVDTATPVAAGGVIHDTLSRGAPCYPDEFDYISDISYACQFYRFTAPGGEAARIELRWSGDFPLRLWATRHSEVTLGAPGAEPGRASLTVVGGTPVLLIVGPQYPEPKPEAPIAFDLVATGTDGN